MMELQSSRKIDELGRILLPIELRNKMGWEANDSVSLYFVDGNTVIMQLKEKHAGADAVADGQSS